MIYRDFQDVKLPLLGFGAMRLPLLADGSEKVDEAQVRRMTAYALSHGVRYFDTAYFYHKGESERIMGRVLSDYPRDSFLLATKFPGHMLSERRDPAAIFEEQLEKCGVSYFDFYLLHNVSESSVGIYTDPDLGILPYLLQQRRNGRIRHLGFSSHGQMDNLRAFVERYGSEMEFCQIQLNYLDWTFQDAKAKYAFLTERGIPVWVMEPVRADGWRGWRRRTRRACGRSGPGKARPRGLSVSCRTCPTWPWSSAACPAWTSSRKTWRPSGSQSRSHPRSGRRFWISPSA